MTGDSWPAAEWCENHFDFTAPELRQGLYQALDHMRQQCPVTHSDAHNGYWVVTRYEDVLQVAEDWRTFSNQTYNETAAVVPLLPITLDPPTHTLHRQLVSPYFTPSAMARFEEATRQQAIRLIDEFIEVGECEFMEQFARPFPGLVLFHEVIHAPAGEIAEINEMATIAGIPDHPQAAESWGGMVQWVQRFVEQRRHDGPRGDVVDAIIGGQVDGKPLSEPEITGTLVLLIMGGLETTAGALGHFFIRFADQPQIWGLLQRQPDLIPKAIEELMRLDVPFPVLQRTAAHDTEIRSQQIKKGDQLLIYLASANRDEAEVVCPEQFDLERPKNRQIAFGVGPHRCVGSNLARMNLRVALEELLPRLGDVAIQADAAPIEFHNAFNRAPLTVPITFTPARRTAQA